jgi:16S rRNA (guanine966-N2)-methyltransferase
VVDPAKQNVRLIFVFGRDFGCEARLQFWYKSLTSKESHEGIKILRIIAGKYRGRNLKSPPSLDTRPTSDRLRETLFNVIAPRIEDARFLDLCAGSGAIGIEALSRGAAHVTFVDRSRKMCGLIESNLDLCRVPEEQTEVILAEAASFLRQAAVRNSGPWDLIFFDPPYKSNYGALLESLGSSSASLIDDNGLLIVEHHHKNVLEDEIGRIIRTRVIKQGDSSLSFYQKST